LDLIGYGERGRFVMAAIALRADFDAFTLRAAAKKTKDAAQARRLLAQSSPGNSQSRGRAMRHQSGKSSSNCGESIA
jgi:hypothetical protein